MESLLLAIQHLKIMSNYAKVVKGKVVDCIVADADFFNNWIDTSPGKWIEETPARKNKPGKGFTYDKAADVFYAPQPYPSWTLNTSTYKWEPPVAQAADATNVYWDETSKTWKDRGN